MMAPLELTGVVKRFADVTAVDGVDLTLEGRDVLALVGPSGCGKSTLLRSIAGLLAIDAGMIRLGGELVDDGTTRLPPERRSAGLVFQDHALFPHLSVRDNVAFGVRDVSGGEVRGRVDDALALVSLEGYGERFPHELSGGEQQRVALARALAPRPALMLFDEPFASLDYNLRVGLRRDVLDALRTTNTPAVFVTHDQREALTLGDRVAVMQAGKIVQVGSPAQVFHAPVSPFVGSFMGDASFLPVTNSNGTLVSALGEIEANEVSGRAVVAMVRPDDIDFRVSVDGSATVTDVEYHGSGWLVTAELADGTSLMSARSHLLPIAAGDRCEPVLVSGHRQILLPAD